MDDPTLTVLALLLGTLVVLAYKYDGKPFTEVELNDGGVWVTNESLGLADVRTLLQSGNVVFKLNAGKRVGNFNLARCRSVTDQTDELWSAALGLTDCRDDIDLSYAKIVKTSFDIEESEQD